MIQVKKTITIPDSLKNKKFQKHFKKFLNNEVQVSGIYYGATDVRESLKKEYNLLKIFALYSTQYIDFRL